MYGISVRNIKWYEKVYHLSSLLAEFHVPSSACNLQNVNICLCLLLSCVHCAVLVERCFWVFNTFLIGMSQSGWDYLTNMMEASIKVGEHRAKTGEYLRLMVLLDKRNIFPDFRQWIRAVFTKDKSLNSLLFY